MQKANDHLLQILKIIGYTDDKGKFIEEFTGLNQIEVIKNRVENLPDDIKKKTEFTEEDIKRIQQHSHITEQEFLHEVEKIAQKELREYIKVVTPSLTLEQRQQITALMREQKSKHSYKNPLNLLKKIKNKFFH
jgi:hypothetical protein